MHSSGLTKDTTLMRHRYQSFILILHSQAFMQRPPGSSNPPASELHQDKSSYWPNRGALIKHSVDTTTPKWITHLLTTRSDKRYPRTTALSQTLDTFGGKENLRVGGVVRKMPLWGNNTVISWSFCNFQKTYYLYFLTSNENNYMLFRIPLRVYFRRQKEGETKVGGR